MGLHLHRDRAGEVETVSDDVRRITGRAPIGLRELLGSASGAQG